MRSLGLALAVLALGAAPALGQQNKKVDVGEEFSKWLRSDDKGGGTASSGANSGDGLSGLVKGLFSSKKESTAHPATMSREGTARATSGGRVTCASDGTMTRSGSLVVRCFAGEADISGKLIEGGYGVEWREVSGGAYAQLEAAARSQKRGVWSGQ